ncbi:response regulator [bacterium]|nr:response regulator [bacterium]
MGSEKKATILCVDDEPDILDSLFDTFMDDFNVKTASCGADALKLFETEDIALIISDQRMPNMEGSELLAKVNEIKPVCKKILLTGYADINAAVDAINKGSVDRYFSKPWDDEELVNTAKHLIKMYNADNFLLKMQKDGERFIKEKATIKGSSESISNFMNNYPMGLCIAGEGNKIEFVNKKGLDILQYGELANIKGRDFRDIFQLDHLQKKEFEERYAKNDLSPGRIEVTLKDGSTSGILGSLIFDMESSSTGRVICGAIFNKASHMF